MTMSIVARLRREIAERKEQIEELQAACTHPAAAVTKTPVLLSITEYYEDEIGGRSQGASRKGYRCTCGLCESEWHEYEDGRRYSQFDSEDIGRI